MYAIVEIAGKQYKVQKNDKLVVPRLGTAVDDSVTFDRVLLVSDGDDVQLGTPVVESATVTAKVVEHFKGDKVLVFRKKRRKRFKVKRGHRQPYTRIEVSDLSVNGKGKSSKKSESKSEPKSESKSTSKTSEPKAKSSAGEESKASKKSASKGKAKTSTKKSSKAESKGSEKKKSKS